MQENSTVNSLVAIILWNLPKVTSTQHKANKYYDDFFYPALNLTINCEIVDSFANKLYKTIAQGLSPATIAKLHNSISHITLQKKKDCRGHHATVACGAYLERGGSGSIRIGKFNNTPNGRHFIQQNSALWQLISDIMTQVDPVWAHQVSIIPEKYRLFGLFLLCFININSENINLYHRDCRDWRWCVIIPFGEYSQGCLDLKYLNCQAHLRAGDVGLLYSRGIWHSVKNVVGIRNSIVLVVHTGLLNRFTNVLYKHDI